MKTSKKMRHGIRPCGPRSWEIKINIGKDPATKRARYRWVYVEGSRADARAKQVEILETVRKGDYVDATKDTVADLLRRWLDHARLNGDVSPTTLERYQGIVERRLIPWLGHIAGQALTSADIEGAWLKARDDLGLSTTTLRQFHVVLLSALRHAVRRKVLARNPMDADEMPLPKARDVVPTTLDTAQSAALLAAIKHTALYLPAMLALHTGMRRGEILALRWREVDLSGARLSVVRSLEQTKAGGLRFKEPKREHSRRTIALPALAVDELRRHKAEQAEQRLRLGLGSFDEESLVVCKHDGEPMRPRTATIEFGRLMRRVKGIPRVRFHDLRHSHFTQMMQLGINPKIVSERAGHSTVAFTLKRYQHAQPGMQEEAAAKIDAAFRRVGGGAANDA